MSLRRKVLLVFLLVNVLTLASLAAYALYEGKRSSEAVEKPSRQALRRAELALELTRSLLQREMDVALSRASESRTPEGGTRSSTDDPRLLLSIWRIPVFDQPGFRRLVRKAVFVRFGAPVREDRYFNVRRDFIFDEDAKDDSEIRRMISGSIATGGIVRSGDRVAGPLTLGGSTWGGFYLALASDPGLALAEFDRHRPLRYIVIIAVPGILFMFWFLLRFMNRNVVGPVEELETVALSVAHGDYSRRIRTPFPADEVGRVKAAVNQTLDLVEDYRDRMQARIEEKTVEIERKTQELQLGQRLAATGTLASGIAHEINNPLGGMLNALKRVERAGLSPEKKKQYLEIIAEGIERIGHTVKQVLAVAPTKTTPGPLDLADIVRRTLHLVSHRARVAQVEIVLDLDSDVPPVLGESNEIGQVCLNLLINAVDACEAGGRVEVSLAREGPCAILEVSDDGHGMQPEVAERAFDYFFTTKAVGEGAGLGLAIVHHIVEAHGGSILLASAPGEGARFTIRLPLGAAEQP